MNTTSDNKFFLKKNNLIQTNKKLSLKSKKRLQKTKSDNTLRAYESDWLDFYDWCNHAKLSPLPAEPETVINYINDLADNAKANTVSRRLSAISENHKAANFFEQNPCRHALVRNALDSIKREKGTMQHGKAPILMEDITELSSYFAIGDITGIRDKALVLIGFMGAFRRSELVAINIEDLSFSNDGVIILISKSKGDQDGRGEYVAIPYASTHTICAVTALKNWLNELPDKSGPLFRPLNKHKQLRNQRLTSQSVALILKKYVALAGFNPDDFAGHSLRRGFATSAAQHDVDERNIMQQTRHKSEKMVRRYIEQGNLFKNNPLHKMF